MQIDNFSHTSRLDSLRASFLNELMETQPFESPEPSRLERIKRFFQIGATYNVIGQEGADQMEQALLVVAHERGSAGFRRNTPTEQPLTIYRRDNKTN